MIDDEVLRAWAERHGTPFYVADPTALTEEMNRLRAAFRSVYPHTRLAYSLKTNYLPSFVRSIVGSEDLLEVVSRHELEYVLRLGAPADRIIFNGPVKRVEDVRRAHVLGVAVHVDSLDELGACVTVTSELVSPLRVGIRFAATLANGSVSRFGIPPTPTHIEEIRRVLANADITVAGLHTHHSSERSAVSYGRRVRMLARAATSLNLPALEYLDIGGGQASAVPDAIREQLTYPISTFDEYARAAGDAMKEEFGGDGGPTLILEPGTAVLSGSMTYVCQVVSTRGPHASMCVVDGTMFAINPLRSSVTPPIRCLGGAEGSGTTDVHGATCMEIDVLGTVEGRPIVGDILEVSNVGAYSFVLAPDFIVPRAPIVDAATGEVLRPRQPLGDLWSSP